jgi:hypothetical protein
MPPLGVQEREALKESIRTKGVEVPIVLDSEGNIIDGYNRTEIVEELRAEGSAVEDPPTVVRDDLTTEQEKLDAAWSLNMQRRHLGSEVKRDLIDRKLKETPRYSDRWLAELLGVDHKTVKSRRLSLEAGGEIPQVDRALGKDGKEYPRNVVGEYVDEVARRERIEAERRESEVRGIIRTKLYLDDGYIAAKVETSPDYVAEERQKLEAAGAMEPTVGDLAGRISVREPDLVEDRRKLEAEKRNRTREARDEGMRKDTDSALEAIDKLARALYMHRLKAKPKRYIFPDDAAQAYRNGFNFRKAMDVRTEGDYVVAERYKRFAHALFGTPYDEAEDDPRGRLSHAQERLTEDLDNFDRLADWMRDFANLVRSEAQKELKVIQKTEADYLENRAEMEREEAEQRGASVSPLVGRSKKKRG